ncbi:hypothetical protein D3C72_2164690 [compost metagenome]
MRGQLYSTFFIVPSQQGLKPNDFSISQTDFRLIERHDFIILNDCPSKGQLFGGKLDGFKHGALKHTNATTATDFKIIQGDICTL